jgi:DNA-binding NarL/FixJ family response regulator
VIHVLIIDDHPVVVAGLTVLIDSDTDLAVAASARSAAEVRLLPTGTTVDLAIVDLQLPDTDGITFLACSVLARHGRRDCCPATRHNAGRLASPASPACSRPS